MFKFENTKPIISNDDLPEDLRTVAAKLGTNAVPQTRYRQLGRHSTTAVKKRFETWNAAIVAAGLSATTLRDLSSGDLLDNLRDVWTKLGRQPRKGEMVKPISKYSRHPYIKRFGGWLSAIRAFVAFVDQAGSLATSVRMAPRGPRDPSLRLRFLVMRRDRFTATIVGSHPVFTQDSNFALTT